MTQTLKITVYGAGYVGLITACCLADVGFEVCCMDIDAKKIAQCEKGDPPIYEADLPELLKRVLAKKTIRFVTSADEAVDFGVVQFIAVGTPSSESGEANLAGVKAVANTIGERLSHSAVIVIKSTVPVGTSDEMDASLQQHCQARGIEATVCVASNPEFLREGVSIKDFMEPDRVVIGANDDFARSQLKALYQAFLPEEKMILMDRRSSEMSKYVANAMLATKISFMNEMSQIAEKVGADIESVRDAIGRDHRIGPYFISPGCGFGGSCFPKDVSALIYSAEEKLVNPQLLSAVMAVNERQKDVLFAKIARFFSDDLSNKVIAIWGLAFKPGTDDMRDAPSLKLIEQLIKSQAMVKVYDPAAMDNAKKIIGDKAQVIFCDSRDECLQNADALALLTEWPEFRDVDFSKIKDTLRSGALFDGRNLYDPTQVRDAGIHYYGIGRGKEI